MLVQEIIVGIKNCQIKECHLRDNLCEKKFKRTSNATYSFYYSDKNIDKSRFIMIMQNPGLSDSYKPESQECNDYENATENIIDVHRDYLWNWLNVDNKNFFNSFIGRLFRYGIIRYKFTQKDDPVFKENVLSDFLFTDAVKCRAQTKDINHYKEICYNHYLKNELKYFGKNKLMFVFSSRSWDTIHKFIKLEPLLKSESGSDAKYNLANVHGQLFYSIKLESYFIPLAHFSRKQMNNYLHNSYFDYLDEGLKKYSEIKNL